MASKKKKGTKSKGKGIKRKKASRPRSEPECANCGKVLSSDDERFRKQFGKRFRTFCSKDCITEYKEESRFKEHRVLKDVDVDETPTTSRAHFVLATVLVLIILLAALVVAIPYFLPPKVITYFAELDHVQDKDINILNVTPHGDQRHTNMVIEIAMSNRGTGPTGKIMLEVLAENLTSKIIDDGFNTTSLRFVENSTVTDFIPPEKTVKASGSLRLRPGNYSLKIKIYEDGLKSLVEGHKTIKVTKEQVTTQPWQQTGGDSRGKETEDIVPNSGAPGFELGAMLLALIIVYAVRTKRKTTKK